MGASIKHGGTTGRRGKRTRHAPMGEINVTPFVDVMLVLLIIFMVAAPLMATGVPIDLPKTTAKPLDAPKKEPLLVSIDKEGKVFIGTTPIALADLAAKMKAIGAERGTDEPIQISGDTQATYGIAVKVIAQITAAGFHKVALRTDPPNGGG
jgi:biopolymer transport protein TolR